MPELSEASTVQWAYICGGYDERFRAIANRLQKLGINVAGHCDSNRSFSVPKRTTLIIVVSDQCSHSIRDMAVDAAEKLDLPYIAGPYKNWVHMEARLASRGFTKKMELVAGGEEIIPTTNGNGGDTTIGNVAKGASKLAALRDAIERARAAPPAAPPEQPAAEAPAPAPVEPSPAPIFPSTKPTNGREMALAIQKALRQVFESHKDHLTTFTNVEAAEEAKGILGWSFHNSVVGLKRREMGYAEPPKGYKRPRQKDASGKHILRRDAPPSAALPNATTPPKAPPRAPSEDPAERDFDTIQAMLDEWVLKNHIGKLYLSFDNGEWDVNWDQVKVVTREKKYTRKGK